MQGQDIQSDALKNIPAETWKNLAKTRIFFGHKSVGQNIIDGLNDILAENPQITLKIVQTRNEVDMAAGIFAHAPTGHNMDFQSKIDDFQKIINEDIAGNVDIAFQKFCYIDFDRHTDSEKRFSAYKTSILELKKKHPDITFIHTTVPLVAVQTGPKAWIKKLLGKSLDGTDDNAMRAEYNELLRKTFQGVDPVFDVARVESTYPDGKRELVTKNGKQYEAMIPAYTDDGGHLNEVGRRRVATELLVVLADVASNRKYAKSQP